MFCHPVILQFLTGAYFETSLAMVSYYDYEIRRHMKQVVKPFLIKNACSFNFFLKKVKLVDEMIQSAYLCAILTCQAQKITTYLFRDFN